MSTAPTLQSNNETCTTKLLQAEPHKTQNSTASRNVFMIDAPAGTGETYTETVICAHLRSMSKLVLCVASTGIAGLQLPGGWTAHSMFKLPLEEKNVSGATCNISAETQRAEVLRKCDLIVWDEIPMSHRFSVEALNLTLQDLMGNTKLMGGKTVLLSGDLRQIGPVVKFGGPAETIDASIISSPLWKHVQRMRLTNSNETARTLRTLPLFATWALVRNRTRLQMTASTFPH